MITHFWSVELFSQPESVVNLQFDGPEVRRKISEVGICLYEWFYKMWNQLKCLKWIPMLTLFFLPADSIHRASGT